SPALQSEELKRKQAVAAARPRNTGATYPFRRGEQSSGLACRRRKLKLDRRRQRRVFRRENEDDRRRARIADRGGIGDGTAGNELARRLVDLIQRVALGAVEPGAVPADADAAHRVAEPGIQPLRRRPEGQRGSNQDREYGEFVAHHVLLSRGERATRG